MTEMPQRKEKQVWFNQTNDMQMSKA